MQNAQQGGLAGKQRSQGSGGIGAAANWRIIEQEVG
jgi:hypothetical protein